MERLTQIIDDGLDEIYFKVHSDKEGAYNILDIAKYSDEEEKQEILLNIAKKLAAYENLEERGLLHKAPIPNGTIIYAIMEDSIDDFADDVYGDVILTDAYIYGHTESMYGEFGKDWFLSEKEAEEI